MATTKSQKYHAPQFMPGDGRGVIISDKITPAAAALNDIFDFKIPGGMNVTNVEIQCDDLDSNGTPTLAFSVGYSPIQSDSVYTEDLTYFAAAGQTTARAGGRLVCAFEPKKFEEDVMLRVKVTTAAATFQAGDIFAIIHGSGDGVK